jgi:hypothetical protein
MGLDTHQLGRVLLEQLAAGLLDDALAELLAALGLLEDAELLDLLRLEEGRLALPLGVHLREVPLAGLLARAPADLLLLVVLGALGEELLDQALLLGALLGRDLLAEPAGKEGRDGERKVWDWGGGEK